MKWLTVSTLLGGIFICWWPYPAELARLAMSVAMLFAIVLNLIERTDG